MRVAIARDKFWMFGVRAHQDDVWLGRAMGERVTHRTHSRITPAEGAAMLDVPNMLLVNCDGVPAPFSEDAIGYAESFCRMHKVMWSGTGSAGFRAGNEEAFTCELARRYPNVGGEYLDDVAWRFHAAPDPKAATVDFLREVREGLDKAPRPMEIYVTWYWGEEPYPGMADYVDGFCFWTARSGEIPLLRERFEAIEPSLAGKKIFLGIYMYDYRARAQVPLDMMEMQCEYALSLLREGRIDGMIFLGNSVMGVGMPSEMWLRAWIDKVKYTEIPD